MCGHGVRGFEETVGSVCIFHGKIGRQQGAVDYEVMY